MSALSSVRALPGWRAGVLLVAGVAAAVFIGPLITGAGRQAVDAATSARWVNCPGVAFDPANSGQTYGFSASVRTGAGVFDCALVLPHRATITAVKFHLFDSDAGDNVGCRLHRVKLNNGAHDFVTESKATSGSPGFVTLTATSITHPVVDDRVFTYWAGCTLGADTTDLGIVGVSVRYVP